MDKPVSITVDSASGEVYVVTVQGHVYRTLKTGGAWKDLGAVPGTSAAKKKA